MASVTQRIKQIKQPYGGYLKPSVFEEIRLNDGKELGEENIHSSLVGLTVDYLTRTEMGATPEDAFKISLMGAALIGEDQKARKLLDRISGLDDMSIQSACKMVGYDVVFRAGVNGFKNVDGINPDGTTIENIRVMVKRAIKFFNQYGPVVKDGFTFEGGYTEIIDSGDGDFLTRDTLWDFKVSKNKINSSQTLQLLIYYIMGLHSVHSEFDVIKKLGIFNPRLNVVYLYPIEKINDGVIKSIEEEVICYNESMNDETSKVGIDDNTLYTVTELMRILGCSRYTVMKYYSQEGLPLFKYKNKYVVKRTDLLLWVEEMKEKRRMQQAIAFVAIGIIVLIMFLWLIFVHRR